MVRVVGQKIRVETGSCDERGLLLFLDGKLIACLIELSDPAHGHLRRHWTVEAAFGFDLKAVKESFATMEEAIRAITRVVCGQALDLTDPPIEIR